MHEARTAPPMTARPAAFVIALSNASESTTQLDFTPVSDADSLTCVLPPDGGDYWPFGGDAGPSPDPATPTGSNHPSTGTTTGIIIGAIIAVILVGVMAWFARKWALSRLAATKSHSSDYAMAPASFTRLHS